MKARRKNKLNSWFPRFRGFVFPAAALLICGLSASAVSAYYRPFAVWSKAALRDELGDVLKGSNPTNPAWNGQTGDLVQIIEAGADGLISPPDASGNPTGDDMVLTATWIGWGVPWSWAESGRFAYELGPPPEGRVYVRIFNAPTGGEATYYGDSAVFSHGMDLAVEDYGLFSTNVRLGVPTPPPSPVPTAPASPPPTPPVQATPTPAPSAPATPPPTPFVPSTPTPFVPPTPPPATPSPAPSPSPTAAFPILESGDYNGDGVSDIGIFRPTAGLWALRGLSRAYFGSAGDLPAAGDYDGNGTSEIAVFRQGLWAVPRVTRVYLGMGGDVPAPADYDGDGTADRAVFRPASGLWAEVLSGGGSQRIYWGKIGDQPIPLDFDADGSAEVAVFRPSGGLWAIRNLTRLYLGSSGDLAVPREFGDAVRAAAAVYRPASGLWVISGLTRFYFGGAGAVPVPAAYDGAGADPAVFRPASGYWAVRGLTRLYFGGSSDFPVAR